MDIKTENQNRIELLKRTVGYTVVFIWLLLPGIASAQRNPEDLENYYPNKLFGPLEINVLVHVLQYSDNDPRNFVPADTGEIYEVFDFVNQMYNTLGQPTLKVPDVPYFRESGIKFKISKVFFHVDSVGWKVDWYETDGLAKVWANNGTQGLFRVNGKNFRNYLKKEGVGFKYKSGKMVYAKADTAYYKDNFIYVKTKENIDTTGLIEMGYNRLVNQNCSSANFDKYARQHPYALNVFLTQSTTSKIIFGCGPSKSYLNLSNVYKGDKWVAAQLMAHELGHCLGLSHTDYPQFSDLPKKDKFGWIHCDTIEVSNNIMGYNICRNYLSPMQLGFVHRNYSTKVDYINTTLAHNYNPNRLMMLDSTLTLERGYVFNGDIVIRKNKKLIVKKPFYITSQTKIYIEDNAQLIIDGGMIIVLDQKQNNNVVYCRKYKSPKKTKKKGVIKTINNGKIIGLQL